MALSLGEIEELLASGADRQVDGLPFTYLEHGLQVAALLRRGAPDDVELAMAGLVHDIGHSLPGVNDATHAEAGAAAVRTALGDRVAALVGLHVQAKRYLVARQARYGDALAADSVVSLGWQGGPMSPMEQAEFERNAYAQDALLVRRADDGGKVDGLVTSSLDQWMERWAEMERNGRAGLAEVTPHRHSRVCRLPGA